MKDSLGDRMKFNYEQAYNFRLPARMPIVMRLDGKCFHTFTKGMQKPFDEELVRRMRCVATFLMENISGAQVAYIQSDEISILIHNYKKLDSEGWFGNEIQKMTSISAAMASTYMSEMYSRNAFFDSRVFVIPEAEVNNYFIWRQKDAIRNSISMLAQANFSHKELQNKNTKQVKKMLEEKGILWEELPLGYQRGSCVFKMANHTWADDVSIPLFTEDHEYIDKFLKVEEE
jgi:tRNA(His) 5'-end guanylyltransferase